MRIPRDFDRWMFDYKEGNLSQTEIDYFEQFVIDNPQFDSDVEAWDNSYVKNHQMAYPQMESLLREKSTGKWLGWAATITILFMSFAGLFFFSPKHTQYTPRVSQGLNGFKWDESKNTISTLPQSFNKTDVNTSTHDNNENGSNASQTLNGDNTLLSNSNQLADLNTISVDYETYSIDNHLTHSSHSNRNKSNSNHQHKLIDVELNKLSESHHSNNAVYLSNPKFSKKEVKTSKSKRRHNSMAYKVKRLYRKIERMTGYPIGLVNLHDPEILTPNSNVLTNNYGFTGSFGSPRFEAKHRLQWLGEEQTSELSTLSFDTYSKALKSGLGVILNRNSYNQGLFSDYNVNFLYSPKFQIGRKLFFEPAIKLTLGMMRMDHSKLSANTTYEIERGRLIKTNLVDANPLANNMWYKDFGLGFVLNAEKFYAGLNIDNIGRHNEIIYGNNELAPLKINAIIGSDYQSKDKKMILSPFITYSQVDTFKEVWGGINTKYHWLTVGGAYSTKGDYSASIGLKLRNFKLIYQYDKTTSFINNDRFASHNIGIRINAKQKQQR